MYRPTTFDPSQRYPIINHIYPGPQTGSVGGTELLGVTRRHPGDCRARLHRRADRRDGHALAVAHLPRGVLRRHGRQHLPDQVAGMKELASRYPWIDLERAGIYGHSGGGFASAGAMFRYPDFFKVGVSQAGNHDNRVYEDDWGEKWQGLLVKKPDGTTNYDDQANQNHAQEPEGQAPARARHDGPQRAVLLGHAPRRGRADSARTRTSI
jgi:dipeptidyl-peptidase 4